MQSLQSQNKHNRAVAVAVMSAEEAATHDAIDYEFRSHTFSVLKGFQALLRHNTSCILLDYFWLQQGYYRSAYGMRWVIELIPYAFDTYPAMHTVVLPLESWYSAGGGLMEMLLDSAGQDKLRSSGISYALLSWKRASSWHPLVRATLTKGMDAKLAEHAEEQKRFVDADAPFVAFFRSLL